MLANYLSILQSANSNDTLSDEGRQILSIALDETKGFLDDRQNERTNIDYQGQLNLLHVICDSHNTLQC